MTRHDVEVFSRQMSGRSVVQHRHPCIYPVSRCKALASCPDDFHPYVEPDDQVLMGPILTQPVDRWWVCFFNDNNHSCELVCQSLAAPRFSARPHLTSAHAGGMIG